MVSREDAQNYLLKARKQFFLTQGIVDWENKITKEVDFVNAEFDKISALTKDQLKFPDKAMDIPYGKFLRNTVEYFVTLCKNKEHDKVSSVKFILSYIMNNFPFSYKVGLHTSHLSDNKIETFDVSMVDNDEKELFCRRRLDYFPFFLSSKISEDEMRKVYGYFFVLFCYDYNVSCCDLFLRNLDRNSSVEMISNLECIIENEKNGRNIPIDYVFWHDNHGTCCHLIYRSLGIFGKGLRDTIKENRSK